MKTFKTDDVVLVPRASNSVWAGVGVVYRTWEDDNKIPLAGVLMLSGQMRGSRGGFNFSELCPAKITKTVVRCAK